MLDFFNIFVNEICGSDWIAMMVLMLIYTLICLFGRFGFILTALIILIISIAFGTILLGGWVYFLALLLSLIYFMYSLIKLFGRE